MNEEELNRCLAESGKTLKEACMLIYIITDETIEKKHVENALLRGCLSRPMTAVFRFLFLYLKGDSFGRV